MIAPLGSSRCKATFRPTFGERFSCGCSGYVRCDNIYSGRGQHILVARGHHGGTRPWREAIMVIHSSQGKRHRRQVGACWAKGTRCNCAAICDAFLCLRIAAHISFCLCRGTSFVSSRLPQCSKQPAEKQSGNVLHMIFVMPCHAAEMSLLSYG